MEQEAACGGACAQQRWIGWRCGPDGGNERRGTGVCCDQVLQVLSRTLRAVHAAQARSANVYDGRQASHSELPGWLWLGGSTLL